MTTVNITTSTVTINNYTSTYHVYEQKGSIFTKVCSTCHTNKQLTEFYKCKASLDGYKTQCKSCNNNQQKDYVKQNRTKISNYRREYYEKNKIKEVEHQKQYYKVNKDKILQQHCEYYKNLKNINFIYRLITNNRSRIYKTLNSNNKATNTIELLGGSKEFYYNWIKWQLPYEMDDNEFKENYDIDHCRPIATFDLSNPENQYDAFHWSNCQSLLKSKNYSKGAKRNLYSEVLQDLKATVFLKLYYSENC